MKTIKKIIAAVVAAASIGAISVTASAEEILDLPTNWIAVRQQGAPSNVNKTYYYPVYAKGKGYDISCTFFTGDYDRNVLIKKQYDIYYDHNRLHVDARVTDLHSTTHSPIYVEHPRDFLGNSITFSFLANSFYNCNANGIISEHK